MSVIPLSARLPNGTRTNRKSRDLPGTVNIPYGYRLSQQGQTRRRNVNVENIQQPRRNVNPENAKSLRRDFNEAKVKQSRGNLNFGGVKELSDGKRDQSVRAKQQEQTIAILPIDPTTWDAEDNAKEVRENESFMRTYEFVERTDKKIRRKNIRHLVDEGMAEYEETIDARREKLRGMIVAEQKVLTREIIDQARQGADWRMDYKKKRTEELRERLEKQRQTTVTEKRMQQYLTQCPEAREKISKKTTLETKYSNLVQIAENDAKRQAEREVDGLWYELMLREVEAKKAREIEEEKRRAIAGKDVLATLEKQIAGKLVLSEEEKRVKEEEREYLERLWDSVRQEELLNHQIEKNKRAKLKKDLEEQLLVAKRCLAERAKEEAAMDRAFRELGEAELAKERAALRESSSRLRGEILAYMRSLEELREEEARRNIEVEAMVQTSAREAESKRDIAMLKSKESRARTLREVLEGREQQLRAKRAAYEEENKRAVLEAELQRKEMEVEAALTAEAEARRRENALRYGQELKAQQKYVETMRRRENEENDRIHRVGLERELEYQKLTEELLNAPEIITPHAFKIMLKECAARRDAEQKGLCYCSPSQPLQSRPPDYP